MERDLDFVFISFKGKINGENPFKLVRGSTLYLGRSSKNDIQTQDPFCSSKHLEIEIDQDKNLLIFRDLESKNGSFLNGVRSSEGSLYIGDTLRCGEIEIYIDEARVPLKNISFLKDPYRAQGDRIEIE